MIALKFLARTITHALVHPMCVLPVNAYSPSSSVMILKKNFEDTKGCDLRFDQHQTLESVVDQYTGILKNMPYEYVAFSISVGFNFRCNVLYLGLDHFAIIFTVFLKIKLYAAPR
jgi:hypothetical protein